MTEKDLQLRIYLYRDNISAFPAVIPNVYHFNWESDLIYISKNNYLHEFEIKTTKSDYKKDFEKYFKHRVLSGNDSYPFDCPKTFTYVCPEGIIDVDTVPEYAGLIYCNEVGTYIKKKSPTLKSKQISDNDVIKLLNKGTTRYWNHLRKVDNDSI